MGIFIGFLELRINDLLFNRVAIIWSTHGRFERRYALFFVACSVIKEIWLAHYMVIYSSFARTIL